MSLLIKALDKAQAEKAQAKNAPKNTSNNANAGAVDQAKTSDANADASQSSGSKPNTSKQNVNTQTTHVAAALSLSPLENASGIDQAAPQKTAEHKTIVQKTAAASQQENAANVFYAKRDVDQSQSIKLAIGAGFAIIALFGLGLYYYLALNKVNNGAGLPKNLAVNASNIAPNNAIDRPEISAEISTQAQPVQIDQPPALTTSDQAASLAAMPNTTSAFATAQPSTGDAEQTKLLLQHDAIPAAGKTKQMASESVIDDQPTAKSMRVKRSEAIASESASIEITQNKAEPGVNPTLLRAYQAYNAGNDAESNQLYKQVLQRDGVNVDAMLGLGAIALRQNRSADANDWYRKVLEIEPRNSFAQAALLQIQAQVQANNAPASQPAATDESAIKSMLAQTPNDANLYANLGNLYAQQKQWPLAQQAYFEAYRLNASADNAFNLAISLDQLTKPKLALPYYQQALNLSASQANGIDLNALTARINAIEAKEK